MATYRECCPMANRPAEAWLLSLGLTHVLSCLEKWLSLLMNTFHRILVIVLLPATGFCFIQLFSEELLANCWDLLENSVCEIMKFLYPLLITILCTVIYKIWNKSLCIFLQNVFYLYHSQFEKIFTFLRDDKSTNRLYMRSGLW